MVGEADNLRAFAPGALVFGLAAAAHVHPDDRARGLWIQLPVRGVPFRVPVPGLHNVDNALAAIAACQALGAPLAAMAGPLAGFQGVARRFQSLGSARGVEVVDARVDVCD